MADDLTAELLEPQDQGPTAARADRLHDVLAALRGMVVEAEAAGDHGRATSLRLMQGHFEGELAQAKRSRAAVERARRT